jgi:DNA-binding transcriptional LysR family regulator
MKWDRLRLFNIVAQTRNITEASYILHISQSALSRQMKSLENELGVKLFYRNSDGISLTKAGLRLSSSVQILAADINKTHNQLLEDMDVPSGRLNVTATNAFGALWVAPRMSKFKESYPDISVALSLRDSEPRVTNFNSDVEVRMTPSLSQDDVQIKLADCRYKIFASNDYIAKNGFPKTSADLDNHNIISYGEDAQPPIDRHRLNWLLTLGKENKRPRKPILEVSSIYGIAKATEVGMGIASLPDWMEFEMIALTEILSQLKGPEMSISLCFKSELRNDPRIKAFKDFMIKEAEVIN